MSTAVTVEREDGSLVVRIPREIARRLEVDEGDQLHLVRIDRGYALRHLSEDDLHVLRIADEIMVKYDSTLRRLADS
ncbi:MAG TPA: hypothetical protein VK358_12060 [Longimicrobium sp.]|nr:hypothetical protein [Longimicrobium sp.]